MIQLAVTFCQPVLRRLGCTWPPPGNASSSSAVPRVGAARPGLLSPGAAPERLQLAPPPGRLMEFVVGGINQWTAREGALRIREAAYVASEGLAVEQFSHAPRCC